ncbi:cell division protein PerM [Microbacterium radiodurans]|uniref:cell division protein PerM n=1 Tax=Microbacterium radiodurans TaxID=661398 RepID=UPI00168BAF48|nr:DUF6350 family protein [Microbacterium radiodurans]
MNRLLVALLAAFDALVAVGVGLAAALAPLTVLWAVAFDGGADWGALWPAAVRLWQAGNLVPLDLTLPAEYAAATGMGTADIAFPLSLAPLAFAAGAAVFAARSGGRAAGAGAGLTGAAAGTLTVAALAGVAAATAQSPIATVAPWQAILLPALVFGVPALGGALARAWRDGDDGPVDALFVRLDRRGYAAAVTAAGRATGIGVAAFVAVGALVLAVAVFARGGDVVALYQASNVDALGAAALTLGQLAYLPTLVVWAASFAAGPGFELGAGSTVAASGTQLGVVPGIPVLAAVPPQTPPALLLVALLFVAAGVLAGLAARRALAAGVSRRPAASAEAAEPVGPRLAALGGTVVASGAAVAILAVVASGAFGPGRLAAFGPEPGPLALAFAVQIGIGAAIALFGPRTSGQQRAAAQADDRPRDGGRADEAEDLPRVE